VKVCRNMYSSLVYYVDGQYAYLVMMMMVLEITIANSLTELGLQRWLPVHKVRSSEGRPMARRRRACCSELNNLDHVVRSLVRVNEVHLEAQFVNPRFPWSHLSKLG